MAFKLIPWSGSRSNDPAPKPLGLGGRGQAKAPVDKPSSSYRPPPLLQAPPEVAGVTAVPASSTYTMPASQQRLLNDTNWSAPAPDRPTKIETPEDLKYRKKRDLAEYEYELSALQLRGMDDTLSNQTGYRSPAQSSDDKPDIEKEKTKAEAQKGVLTWKQYDKLDDDQKAAVDFNTRLVQARQKDLKAGTRTETPAYSEAQLNQYNADVEEIFGKEGGSDTIAINTVELLKSINFKAVGQDLDEYLSLERAIDADELKNFTLTDTPVTQGIQLSTTPEQSYYGNIDQLRTPENLAAVDSSAVRLNVEAIEAAMTDAERTFWSVDTALNPITPTKENIKDIPFGFGGLIRDKDTPDYQEVVLPDGRKVSQRLWTDDRFYESSWLTLKIPDETIKDPMAEIRQFFIDHEFSPQEQKQWYRTTYQRAMNEKQYGAKEAVGNDGVPRPNRSPDEIIEMLNIGGRRG